MTDFGYLAHVLRNTAVRDLIKAIERDGFTLDRAGPTGARIYRHSDGRRVVIHYHRGSEYTYSKNTQERPFSPYLDGSGYTAAGVNLSAYATGSGCPN